MPNPTIVAASLDDKELRESINNLVNGYKTSLGEMVGETNSVVQQITESLQSISRVKIDLSNTFTGLEKAKEVLGKGKGSATGGSGGGKTTYEEDTIGALKQKIEEQKKVIDQQKEYSKELQEEVNHLERLKNSLKSQLKSEQQITEEQRKRVAKAQSTQLTAFGRLPDNDLKSAEYKLQKLLGLKDELRRLPLLDISKMQILNNRIQETINKIRELRKKPPTLKEVLGMDESSVDAIARKMRALKTVQINPKNAQDVKALSDAYQTLAKRQNEYLGKNRLIQESNKQLTSILNYVRNRIIYAFTVGSMMQFVRDIIRVRAEYEMLDRSLGILVGDFEKGTAIFNELNQMALKSPFTLIELGTAAKQLTAYNFAANEVVDTTRRLADISAALGVPMERLTYNLGQIKAQGVLNARDARDFANAGLAIVPMLAKMYTEQKTFGDQMVTTAQVYDMMSKKMVTYQDVLKVLYQVTDEGGKFFNFQARQAETLKVQLANLTLAYNNMVNEMGEDSQGSIAKGVQLAKKLFENWKEVRRVLLTVITTLGTYKAVSAIVFALNSRMFVGSILVNLRNYINGIKAATGAMATFNAVTRANPIGFLAGALAAVAGYFLWFKSNAEDAAEGVETFGESATKTVNKVKTLQKIIDGTSETSSTYKKALSELSTIAHEHGLEIDAEKASREDANKTIEKTIELIKEEGAERQRANQLTKSQETYDTQTSKVKKDLKKDILDLDGWLGTTSPARKELVKNAEAITDITGSIIEQNIRFVVNKSGKEASEGVDEIKKRIRQGLKNAGISYDALWFYMNKFDVNKVIQGYKKAAEEQENYNQKTENYYNAYKKGAKAIMEFTEKVNANAKALENNSNDALSLYNNIYDIVEIAKKNHVINFDLKLSAEKPPKWMMDIKLPELQRLAARFTAIAQSGGHAQGYDREGTYERGLRYAAAARLKQEEEERKARQKEKKSKTKTKKEDPVLVALREEIKLVKDLQSAYDTLTKKGYSHADAMAKIQALYGKTLNLLNNELSKHGLPLLDVSIVKGNNPNEVLAFFERLRDVLESKGMSNLKRMEVVEGIIKEFRVKADTYNLDMITKGLNNELGKLKDEYELAVELDADPEMGGMFADMFGIDTSNFPKTINEYMERAQQAFDNARKELNYASPLDIFKASQGDWKKWANEVGLSEEALKSFNGKFVEAQNVAKKWAQDTLKQIQTLRYNLADNNGKIAIEEQKLADLERQLAQETNAQQKELLELQRQDIINTIAKLKETVLELLPTYQAAFGEIAEHSAYMSRRLIRNYKNMLLDAQKAGKNPRGLYTVKDKNGKETEITEGKLGKEIKRADKGLRDTQTVASKIKEAFTKGADGVVDIAHGVDLVSGELGKMGQFTGVVTEIFSSFSNPNEYNETAEVMGDIGTTMEGLATAGQGFAKMYSGDIIGGATDMVKGFYSAISTWFDNDDKRILQQIKDSEREVQKLEITVESLKGTYDAMTDSAEHSYGAQSEAAKLAASSIQEQEMALKRLQLAETKRQLQLEKSRDSKKRDEDKIISLRKDIISQQNEIDSMLRETNRAVDEVVDSLLGISRGSWAEELTDAMITAFKAGEDYMDVFEDSWEEMVQNMVVKTIAARVIGDALEKNVLSRIEQIEKEETDPYREAEANIAKYKAELQNKRLENENEWFAQVSQLPEFTQALETLGEDAKKALSDPKNSFNAWFGMRTPFLEKYGDQLEQALFKVYDNYVTGIEGDLNVAQQTAQERALREVLTGETGKATKQSLMDSISSVFPDFMETWGVKFGQDADKELSALQRGIQGITEQQAGALESYWNANTQQQYVQSNLLTQIRDAVVAMNGDIQLSMQGQILLQLQQSYQVQMSIESILQGVLVPSGRAFAVELMS